MLGEFESVERREEGEGEWEECMCCICEGVGW